MDFGLSEEQEMLQQSAREFLTRECPPAFVRELYKDEDGFSREFHRKMAEQGWTGLLIPETYGGLGLGMLDMAVLLEEMGRAVTPGPFLFSSVLFALGVMAGGSAAQKKTWLPRIAAGEAIGTLAFLEAEDRLDAAGVTLRAKKTRDGYTLSGVKMFVPYAKVADVLLIAARTSGKEEEGVSLFLVDRETPGVEIRLLDIFDRTRRVYEVECANVIAPKSALVGSEGEGWKILARLLDAACVALAADSLGGAQKALEMAVEYTKVRTQFNRPIASFQALKHMAAEMVSEIEPSRSLVWYAAHAFDALPREASRAAALAKARWSDVYSRTTNRAVQMHGGIGFTWEHDMHFWFKRAKWNEFAFGDATYHRERLAQLEGF
ncbi:MAG TPA: acyl-CoA dehydrogenase family protein [Methylomirabilota bacterium]|jgi:alkylation response protein AidB-like acyl-CoA dehydrogenase|nr:acyl-CoA dehydrogenase family protein [Methylomirabilota bacterium]